MRLRLLKEQMHRGELILINSKHPVRENISNKLIPLIPKSNDILLDAQAASMLTHLMREIEHEDEIIPVSGYRPKQEQDAIYKESIKNNGEEFTRKYVALPGRSEHQTGFAIDLGENKEDVDFICPDFPYTGIYGKFREKASRYGFIERYQRGKEKITGISHEPWHFRYVGYPHAEIIRDKGICLEEYIDLIKKYRFEDKRLIFSHKNRKIEMFYAPASGDETYVTVPDDMPYQVSGNNVDGFIITIWNKTN
jgi:D-alanyl-D-alanine dipeptidase/carboxypeptidase